MTSGGHAFYGADLIKIMKANGHEDFGLDPHGYSIVNMSMLMNDEADIRVFLLAKLKKDEGPHQATVEMTLKQFNTNVRTIMDNNDEVH